MRAEHRGLSEREPVLRFRLRPHRADAHPNPATPVCSEEPGYVPGRSKYAAGLRDSTFPVLAATCTQRGTPRSLSRRNSSLRVAEDPSVSAVATFVGVPSGSDRTTTSAPLASRRSTLCAKRISSHAAIPVGFSGA